MDTYPRATNSEMLHDQFSLGGTVQTGRLREKRGNQQVYRANAGAPIFAELAGILRKTSGLVDVLADALAPLAAKLQVAFVFGSVAQG